MTNKKVRKNYYLPVNGKLIPVSKDIYEEFYVYRRRERYLEERDISKGLLYFSDYDTQDSNFIDNVGDKTVDVDKLVEAGIVIKELYKALDGLNTEERDLIEKIFFQEQSIREIARNEKISHVAIQKRRNKILKKLKEILKEFED